MALTPYSEILQYAVEHKFTVGAFNSMNMETLQAVITAAQAKDSPLIVQLYHKHIPHAGIPFMSALAQVATKDTKVKIAMGLDHGSSFDEAKACIEAGYSGVMIDLSTADYDRNVYETKQVVELARANNVSVEAELGTIVTGDCDLETIAAGYTDPDVARRFVTDTGIDCLAVSVGTAHGPYTHTPKINFDLVEELVKTVSCPIVVHGGSGTPDEDIVKMVEMGIAKLNVGTDFFVAYNTAMQTILNEQGPYADITEVMSAARTAVHNVALHKIDLLNTFRI